MMARIFAALRSYAPPHAPGLARPTLRHADRGRHGGLALILAGALTALAGCVQTQTTRTEVQTATVPASPDAGPGRLPLSATRAREVFSRMCLDTGGRPAATAAAAAAGGFVLNTTFGTYYHPRDNLSVKLIDGNCSMVFGSDATYDQLSSVLMATAPFVHFRIGPATKLYNVRVAVR